MIATHVLASGAGTNYTLVGVLLAIFVPILGPWPRSSWGIRAAAAPRRAVAMAAYRKLAEEAVANQAELRDQMAKLTEHVSAWKS